MWSIKLGFTKMKRRQINFLIFCLILILLIFQLSNYRFRIFIEFSKNSQGKIKEEIVILTVGCGERFNQSINMMKSVILYNVDRRILKFVIYSEPNLFSEYEKTLKQWQTMVDFKFSYELHTPWFPDTKRMKWSKLFRPCATQRLFLPVIDTIHK